MVEIGHQVEVGSGAFEGKTGTIERIDGDTFTIRLELFGREISVDLTKRQLVGIEAPSEVWRRQIDIRRGWVERTTEGRWWLDEAPTDPLAAAEAFDVFSALLRTRLSAAATDALYELTADPDADLAEVIDRRLPPVYWTDAHAAAFAEGRVTEGGAPKLTDDEHEELVALMQQARERANAARVAARKSRRRTKLPEGSAGTGR